MGNEVFNGIIINYWDYLPPPRKSQGIWDCFQQREALLQVPTVYCKNRVKFESLLKYEKKFELDLSSRYAYCTSM